MTQNRSEQIQEVLDRGNITIRTYPNFVFATCPSSDKRDMYIIHIDPLCWSCTCDGWRGWSLRKPDYKCKHILAIMQLLSERKFMFEGKNMGLLYTTITSLDKFIGGGLPTEEEILLEGPFQIGKTIMAQQLAYTFVASYKKNCLYLGTEEKMSNSWGIWDERFRKRFKIADTVPQALLKVTGSPTFNTTGGKSKEKDYTSLKDYTVKTTIEPDLIKEGKLLEPAMITGFVPNIRDHLALVGYPGTFDIEDSGYYKFRALPTQYPFVNYTPLGQLVEKYHIKFMVVDSISSPIKNAINFVKGNERARANCEAAWLGRLKEICETYGVTMICVAHMVGVEGQMVNIANYKEWGGNTVGHSYKYKLLFLDMPRKVDGVEVPDYDTKRRIYIRRHETIQDMKLEKGDKDKDKAQPVYATVQLTDSGYIDPKGK